MGISYGEGREYRIFEVGVRANRYIHVSLRLRIIAADDDGGIARRVARSCKDGEGGIESNFAKRYRQNRNRALYGFGRVLVVHRVVVA